MKLKTKDKDKEFFDILPQAINRLKKNIIEPFFGESQNEKNQTKKQTGLPLQVFPPIL